MELHWIIEGLLLGGAIWLVTDWLKQQRQEARAYQEHLDKWIAEIHAMSEKFKGDRTTLK